MMTPATVTYTCLNCQAQTTERARPLEAELIRMLGAVCPACRDKAAAHHAQIDQYLTDQEPQP